MKYLLHTIAILLFSIVYISCNKDDYSLNRLPAPGYLSATKGDTSVFLAWEKVDGAVFYTLVRGLNVIADSLTDVRYKDNLAPDTMTEYRVYAVDDMGWRSETYAADSGYLGIPAGIMPRTPATITVSTDNVEGCLVSWTTGRFATSYKLFKNGEFYTDIVGTEFLDYAAAVTDVEYTVYSVNANGESAGISATGRKAYLCMDGYEGYEAGDVLSPWTKFSGNNRVGYYTEGNPVITVDSYYGAGKALSITSGKAQILYDWGGTEYKGYYVFSFMANKPVGSFKVYSSFGVDKKYETTDGWIKCSYKTGLMDIGQKINLTLESKEDESPLYIDDFSIEYIAGE
ncbi:hypothetical protein [uncultured Bacteroides sp.]|uniref:hypothetical protein n=1 Tax=uncultured Bacteroides sp. TaxID=162156 RepID=UPI0025E6A6A9|nr:hypothetical protein [uncultured Bacteroides sp.]